MNKLVKYIQNVFHRKKTINSFIYNYVFVLKLFLWKKIESNYLAIIDTLNNQKY